MTERPISVEQLEALMEQSLSWTTDAIEKTGELYKALVADPDLVGDAREQVLSTRGRMLATFCIAMAGAMHPDQPQGDVLVYRGTAEQVRRLREWIDDQPGLAPAV